MGRLSSTEVIYFKPIFKCPEKASCGSANCNSCVPVKTEVKCSYYNTAKPLAAKTHYSLLISKHCLISDLWRSPTIYVISSKLSVKILKTSYIQKRQPGKYNNDLYPQQVNTKWPTAWPMTASLFHCWLQSHIPYKWLTNQFTWVPYKVITGKCASCSLGPYRGSQRGQLNFETRGCLLPIAILIKVLYDIWINTDLFKISVSVLLELWYMGIIKNKSYITSYLKGRGDDRSRSPWNVEYPRVRFLGHNDLTYTCFFLVKSYIILLITGVRQN